MTIKSGIKGNNLKSQFSSNVLYSGTEYNHAVLVGAFLDHFRLFGAQLEALYHDIVAVLGMISPLFSAQNGLKATKSGTREQKMNFQYQWGSLGAISAKSRGEIKP